MGLSCVSLFAQRHVSGVRMLPGPPVITVTSTESGVVFDGRQFAAFEPVDIAVSGQNLHLRRNVLLTSWTVVADLKGNVAATWRPAGVTGVLTVTMIGRSSGRTTSEAFSAGAPTTHTFNLDQCRNGTIDAPVPCSGANWVNGNLTGTQSHYMEGESIPYRLIFQSLDTTVTHTLTVEYDTTQGGHHALDYLTSFDRTETAALPCDGIADCDPLVHSHVDIPVDPAVTAGTDGTLGTSDDIVQAPGQFTLFNGTILSVSGYTVSGTYGGNSRTSITITFTTTVSDPVLAWGAHIARRQDWGIGNSAIAISGSPFHMRILDSDGEGGGNQDRGVQSDAVYYPGAIVIVQDTIPASYVADFWFDAYGPAVNGFWLDDDGDPLFHNPDTQAFPGLTRFGSTNPYTFVQTVPSPYRLKSINCTSDPQGGSGTDNNTISIPGQQVAITLEEGELVTCTFVNVQIPTAAEVTVSGRVLTSYGTGIRGARVVTTAADGRTVSTLSNAFGYYTFSGMPTGATYIVTVASRMYTFMPRVISVNDTMTDLNLIASP